MADWEPKKVHDVIQDINDNIVVLPVIQRNLVWEEEKMELLFDSLLKGNSFGGIMALIEDRGSSPLFAFRHFSKEGELQDSDLPPVLDRNTMLIIDGQQRLQSFYMGLCGGVNGKKLYFNLFSQDDFDFDFARQISDLPQVIKEDGVATIPLWYPATDLYIQLQRSDDDREAARDIIANRNIEDENQKERIYDNVRRFERAIFSQRAVGISKVYIKKTEPENERQRMVELFRRLNDGGTRLSALDLAASTLKGFDYRLEAFLRRDIPKYGDIGFGQDEVVKLIFLLQDNFAKEVTNIEKEDADFAIENAQRILCTLNVLRQLLKDADLYEYFRSGGRSIIPLYFLAYHIFHKDKPTQTLTDLYVNYDANNPDFTNIKRWLYLSLLNGVFSRGKGWIPYKTGIHKILNIIQQYKGTLFPVERIFSMYEAHPLVFSQDLSVQRLPVWDMSFVFYLIYNCRSLAGRDIDHIQPKSLLEGAQAAPEKIHSVGNYQLLDEDTNRAAKRAKEFKVWINDWNEAERGLYLRRHLIPQNPALWSLDAFDAFLNERSQMIVEKIRACIPEKSVEAQPTSNVAVSGSVVRATSKKQASTYTGAAMLKNSERDPEKWLYGVADEGGTGEEFRRIVVAARSVGLYARFQNAWWTVMFTPLKKRNLGLINLDTSLSVWVGLKDIANYLGCTAELVQEKLGYRHTLQPPEVDQWIENLKSLFAMRKEDTAPEPQPDGPPMPVKFDREAFIASLPEDIRSHPILKDHTTWDDHFIKNKYGGPAWSRRISGELDRAGIYTVADMALLIILLGMRVNQKTEWGNVYVFDRCLPSGEKPFMRTKNFAAWSWKITLQRLQAGGFDWKEYVAK